MAQTSEPKPTPTSEEIEELLLCARYGDESDLQDIETFVDKFGTRWLSEARDDRGNTMLHLSGANGHEAIVSYLLPHLPPTALTAVNEASSTPLHWISLNYHLGTLRLLCPLLDRSAFDLKNAKGKTAVQEAEEACEAFIVPSSVDQEPGQEQGQGQGQADGAQSARAKERVRREVVVGYLLQCMGLGVKKPSSAATGPEEAGEEAGEEATGDDNAMTTTTTVAATAEEKQEMDRLATEAERLKLEGKLTL